MMKHPYAGLPAYTRWTRAVAQTPLAELDPVSAFPFRIGPEDKVATAGSCFAQHIARHLRTSGYSYYIVEDGHPLASDELRAQFNYGVFSARYGNLYTSRQLLQLFLRAYGRFQPGTESWPHEKNGRLVDPFRPTIQPEGFHTIEELRADRDQHLARVRHMFETLDYFVFTLGLTEAWIDRRDGAVYPVAPGVSGGTYNPDEVGFANLSVNEVHADMTQFIAELRKVNPRARIILTVSPVPLAATAEDRHVLCSTVLSKSVLRVVADMLDREHDHVGYFPSFEIISSHYNRGLYFAEDLRSVTEDGVNHVMRTFFRHATTEGARTGIAAPAPRAPDDFVNRMAQVVSTICDEELIERSMAKAD